MMLLAQAAPHCNIPPPHDSASRPQRLVQPARQQKAAREQKAAKQRPRQWCLRGTAA